MKTNAYDIEPEDEIANAIAEALREGDYGTANLALDLLFGVEE